MATVYVLLGLLAAFLFVWFILLSLAERRVVMSLFIGNGQVPDNPAPLPTPPRRKCDDPFDGLNHVPPISQSPYQLLREGEKII